jgi:hypothetical protein
VRFAYGALLFSAYAQQSGGQHLLQPKRSRLYLELSLPEEVVRSVRDDEDRLFAELRKSAASVTGPGNGLIEFDALPSFLPYLLLDDPSTPRDLLDKALRLRRRSDVIEYRGWRETLVHDWRTKKRISADAERELRKLAVGLNHLIQPDSLSIPVKLSGTLLTIDPASVSVGPEGFEAHVAQIRVGDNIKVETELPIDQLWGWVIDRLPGKRYTKLLQRMQLAAHEYRELDSHLESLWKAA